MADQHASMTRTLNVDCCVVGGGPAGVMAGLLFARAGCSTVVLEKHADFLRDFRGDTVHPSTMENIRELGLLEAFLARPHQRLSRLAGVFGGQRLEITDLSSLKVGTGFIAMMPQWEFLDFLTGVARSLPTFAIEMRSEVTELVKKDNEIVGVRAATPGGVLDVRATLVIGADGRSSIVREEAGLAVENIGAPIDVLWFRVPRDRSADKETLLHTGPGHIVVTINRGDYDQCALVIPKGNASIIRRAGLDAFRAAVAKTVPRLATGIVAVDSFDDVKLLTVSIDRLKQWSRPGLIMIGDSAHAMSPVGGVGINLAIQDAVAAANLLANSLASGKLRHSDLEKVRKRRLWPVRATQLLQVSIQNGILKPVLDEKRGMRGPPLPLRIISRTPWLRRRAASLLGLGVRPEHIASDARYPLKVPDTAA